MNPYPHSSMPAMLKSWKNVLTKPSLQTFTDERDEFSGTLMYVLKWILIASMTTAVLAVIRITLIQSWVMPPGEIPSPDSLPPLFIKAYQDFRLQLMSQSLTRRFGLQDIYSKFFLYTRLYEFGGWYIHKILNQIFTPVIYKDQFLASMRGVLSPAYFLINVALFHYASRLLGGQGQFTRYAFLIGAFGAPLTILRSILWYSAYVGGRIVTALPGSSLAEGSKAYYDLNFDLNFLVAIILTSYWFVLTFLATKVEHKLSWWKVVVVLAIGFALGIFLRRLPSDLLMGLQGVPRLLRGLP